LLVNGEHPLQQGETATPFLLFIGHSRQFSFLPSHKRKSLQ
jgi:hypothetical protein